MLFTDLKARVRSLVDDQAATYTTDDFLLPLANQKYEELYNRLVATGAQFERRVVELPAVAAGTADLSAFQAVGQPLELLIQPLSFEFKLAGIDKSNYRRAELVDQISDFTPDQLIFDWEWRSGVIYFTPSVSANDLRVRGDFVFNPLVEDTDPVAVLKTFGAALGYGIASLIGVARGNEGWTSAYTKLQDMSLDDVSQYLARKEQAKIRRVGRLSRRRHQSPNHF